MFKGQKLKKNYHLPDSPQNDRDVIHDRIHSRMYHKTSNFGNVTSRHRNLSEQSKIYFIYCGLTNLHWKIFFDKWKVCCMFHLYPVEIICAVRHISATCPRPDSVPFCQQNFSCALLQKKLWTYLPYVSANAIYVDQPKGLTASHNVDFWWKFIFRPIDSEPFSSSPINNSNFSSLLIHSHRKRKKIPAGDEAWSDGCLMAHIQISLQLAHSLEFHVLIFTAVVNYSKRGIT